MRASWSRPHGSRSIAPCWPNARWRSSAISRVSPRSCRRAPRGWSPRAMRQTRSCSPCGGRRSWSSTLPSRRASRTAQGTPQSYADASRRVQTATRSRDGPFRIANAIQRFRKAPPSAQCPQHTDGGTPGRIRQARHHTEVERDARASMQGRRPAADNHEFNVMVVVLAQNVEAGARHSGRVIAAWYPAGIIAARWPSPPAPVWVVELQQPRGSTTSAATTSCEPAAPSRRHHRLRRTARSHRSRVGLRPTGSVTTVTDPLAYFAANATRKPMNARRAPGSAAPRAEVRTSRAGSVKDPPRITQSASASRPVRSSASS